MPVKRTLAAVTLAGITLFAGSASTALEGLIIPKPG